MKLILSTALLLGVFSGAAFAQSTENNNKVFRTCVGCHKVGADAYNGIGPVLTDVIGRTAGTFEGYNYSKSMIAAGEAGLVWNEENLFEFIAGPTDFLRAFLDDPKARSRMNLRVKNEDRRRDIIAFLATFETAAVEVPKDEFCIVNASAEPYFFATDTREGVRQVANLDPGERLCADSTSAVDGIVSVYESADGFEGCSRIIPVGTSEDMLVFADAGRCGWGSHNS